MSSTILRPASISRATMFSHSHHPHLFSSTSQPPPTDETITTAVTTLTNLRSRSRWSKLRSLFPDGITPLQTTQILLKFRNNPRLAQSFFTFLTRHHSNSSPPTLHCYAILIHINSRAHLNSRAKSLIKHALFSHPQTLTSQRPVDFFRVLVETYRDCDSTPIVFDLLISSLLDVGKFDQCVDIVRLLRSSLSGFSPRVSTCNALIYSACKSRGCFYGYDLYQELLGGGHCSERRIKVSPNVHTFNALMISFYRSGEVDMVEEMWIEMSRLKCTPKVCSYNILMAVYCDQGEMDKARNVWDEVKLKGLRPDVVAYNTLIGGYCKIGEVERGEELYREMGLSGLKGTCVTYQHLINGYCFVGDADSAMVLYKDMCRKGFVLDSSSVDLMVIVLCDKKSASEAFVFFENVMENADFVARKASYVLLIKGLCSEGKMEEALKLQARMVGKGFRPDSVVYGAFIDGYTKLGKLDVAERLKKEMMETRISGDEPQLASG